MHARIPLISSMVAAAALAAAAVAGANVASTAGQAPQELAAGRSCGTPVPSAAEVQQVQERVAAHLKAHGGGSLQQHGGTIRVAFHVITSGTEGDVSDSQIEDQIKELNRNFAGTGYRFELASVDRTDQSRWFQLNPASGAEKQAKQALAIDPAHTLNVYTCLPRHDLLGWSYFPWSLPEDHYLHGIVIHYGSLPGGFVTNFNLGRTLTHEAGHYLGLYHTFQGGCAAPGDFVDDTPFEESPAPGCPIGRNTCPAAGDDPIHNYMDYSDDDCYTEFTAGQNDRMDAIVPVYRPSLFATTAVNMVRLESRQVSAGNPAAFELIGATPHPVSNGAQVRFRLGASSQISLALYSVAGQRVRTLLEGVFPAGDHSAPLEAGALPAGVYFVTLRVNGASQSRTVILTH